MRRRFLSGLILGALVAAVPYLANAQSQNALPGLTRLIVPFAAGGPADFVARTVADKLSTVLGTTVVIDNRPGANGAIGALAVAKAKPDGATLLFATSGMLAISPTLEAKLPYSVEKDFIPIARVVANGTALVVNSSLPANSVKELVALAKSRKEPLTFGSAGEGNITHLYIELLQSSTKLNLVHVPYKGISQATVDVLGGQITGMFADLPAVLTQVSAGKLKMLGIVGDERFPLIPNIPTIAEQGFAGVDGLSWFGILAPAGTKEETTARITESIKKVLEDPSVKKKLQDAGSSTAFLPSKKFHEFIQEDTQRWKRVITERNITINGK